MTKTRHKGVWSEELQWAVNGLAYSFANHFGKLAMYERCCCDMSGCINLFRRIDPDVACIETWAGRELDTCYRKLDDGRWCSKAAREDQFYDACVIP